MATDLESLREQEIEDVLRLAHDKGVALRRGWIKFEEGSRDPLVDNMDAVDWVEALAMD